MKTTTYPTLVFNSIYKAFDMPSPYNTMDDQPCDRLGHAKNSATSTDQHAWAEDDSLDNTKSTIASMKTRKALWAYVVLCFSVCRSFIATRMEAWLTGNSNRQDQLRLWLSTMYRQQFSQLQIMLAISRDQTNRVLDEERISLVW